MGDYLRIARAYLCGTTSAVWCFMFLCLLTFSAVGEELARNQGGMLGGVLSRKSYMAMFAYFNACLLGILLRDNIAHPWASVLPHYRRKHLLVTALIAVFFLAIPMFSMEFVGTSDVAPTSVAVIFLTCLAAGLWTLHHPNLGVLAFPFLAFVMVPSSFFPEFAAFLAGTNSAATAALVFMSLLALGAFAWRLLALNEDMFEYANARMWGDFLRGRRLATTMAYFLAARPADERATIQAFESEKNPLTNLRQVENLSGYSERSLWQRLRLLRLGVAPTRTFVTVGGLILITLIVLATSLSVQQLAGTQNLTRATVVIFSVQVMTNPVLIGFSWFMCRRRLGYESLRPRTRQEFVRELGLALLWDVIQCWLGGVLFMGIAAAIWAPELLQVNNMILFSFCTGVGQLCAYAMYATMGIWRSKQGMLASALCTICPFGAMAIWINFIAMNDRIGFEVNLAIASVLAAASLAAIALAHRGWCRADLD